MSEESEYPEHEYPFKLLEKLVSFLNSKQPYVKDFEKFRMMCERWLAKTVGGEVLIVKITSEKGFEWVKNEIDIWLRFVLSRSLICGKSYK